MKIWYLDSIEYDEFIMFTFYFGSKLSWANKFGPKNQNYLLKRKFGT